MKTVKDLKYSFDHVNQRLKERFDLSISWNAYMNLNDMLKQNKSNMILVEQGEQEIHKIKFKGKVVTFVYSISKNRITTALNWPT